MKNITLTLTACIALSMQAYAGGDMALIETKVLAPIVDDERNDWFVYAAGGWAILDVTAHVTPVSDLLNGALDDKSALFEVGVGYRLNKNIFTTLAWQRTTLDFANIDNLYASINYQFSDIMLKPYIGFVGGYSKLTWEKRPHIPHFVPYLENLTSSGGMYGVQVGLEHDFSASWSLFTKYQYLKYDHTMKIDSAVTTINHNNAQNILLGVRYAF